MAKRLIMLFSSWWAALFLSLGLCGVYAYFPAGENAFGRWVGFLFHSPFGLGLFIAFAMNIVLVTVRTIYGRMRGRELTPEDIRGMDSHAEIAIKGGNPVEAVGEFLRAKGFRVDHNRNGLNAVRGKFSFLPGTIFRSGLVVAMVGLIFSAHLRKSEEIVLHEGEQGVVLGRTLFLGSLLSMLPHEFFKVGEDDTFVLEDVSALISSGGKSFKVRSGYPTESGGIYYRITHVGFSQGLSVGTEDRTLEKRFDLDILPPGKSFTIALPRGEVLAFSLEPDRTITKGILKGKVFNLEYPLYRVAQVSERKDRPAEITIRPGGRVMLGNTPLSLGAKGLFIKITAVSDPALFWIYCGALLILTGMVLMVTRLFWYEKQMSAVTAGNGLIIGYSEEYYKKWGVEKFHRWLEDIEQIPGFDDEEMCGERERRGG